MRRYLIICSVFFGFSLYSNAQSWNIEGTVLAFNRYPLKNISVSTKKSKNLAQTDENGKFTIEVDKKDQIILEAKAFEKFIYRPKEGEKSMKANLIFQTKKKNKELAIQGDYISREHLEYGLKNLPNENNVYSSFTNIYEAVVYAIPSAKIINENNVKKFQLRGVKSTTGSNAALMVVNGFLSDDVGYIIPSSIVSIKQLRPTSAAIFGTGSANGVIEIKTK